jgi:hypothetical protein
VSVRRVSPSPRRSAAEAEVVVPLDQARQARWLRIKDAMRYRMLILVLSLAACEGATDTGPNDDSLGRLLTAEQPSITVTREYFSGITRPADQLITNEEDWARVWAEIYSIRSPAPARPDIQFCP